ncbi:MAG: hypothetical protein AAFO76_16165, partial [Cyanobacteria bacterium J06607_15]
MKPIEFMLLNFGRFDFSEIFQKLVSNVKSHQAEKYNSFTEGYGEVVTSPSGERPTASIEAKSLRDAGADAPFAARRKQR